MVYKVAGDPRRPKEIKHYQRPVVNAEEAPPDGVALVGLMFGMVAVTMKVKLCAWLSLLCCLSSFCTMKSAQMEAKQIVTSATFAIFGIVSSYVSPVKKAT